MTDLTKKCSVCKAHEVTMGICETCVKHVSHNNNYIPYVCVCCADKHTQEHVKNKDVLRGWDVIYNFWQNVVDIKEYMCITEMEKVSVSERRDVL